MKRKQAYMAIPLFSAGDIIEMKKQHPCGGKLMRVLYAGSDLKLRCEKCGCEILCKRIKIEKNIKNVIREAK